MPRTTPHALWSKPTVSLPNSIRKRQNSLFGSVHCLLAGQKINKSVDGQQQRRQYVYHIELVRVFGFYRNIFENGIIGYRFEIKYPVWRIIQLVTSRCRYEFKSGRFSNFYCEKGLIRLNTEFIYVFMNT